MDKVEFKYHNRFNLAAFMSCKSCVNCKDPELQFIVGNAPGKDGKFCKIPFDKKMDEFYIIRPNCINYQVDDIIERDTTYPGATYAPHDNNHPDLLPDSSDIDFDAHAPKRCLNQTGNTQWKPKINNWELCLAILFDRKRPVAFPSPTEVLRLLGTSKIPQFTFRLGLPPYRGMGFDKGLWFYRSEKFNSELDKNANTKSQMKKIIMVYLYHTWFKKLDETKKLGYFLSLETADDYSLAKDLSWWMLNVFKDESALALHPTEDEEIELIPLSLLDKAQQAAMLAATDCNSNYELDLEAKEHDEMLERLGYTVGYDSITDRDGKELY